MKHFPFSNFARTMGLRALVGVLVVGAAGAASAIVSYKVTVTNNTGIVVNDIHMVFTGTGGTIVNRVVVNPGGGVIIPSQGNEFDASFNNLANGGKFIGTFDADFAGVAFNSGNWTYNGANVGAIDPGDVVLEAVPEPASLAVLGLGGLALLRRRRK